MPEIAPFRGIRFRRELARDAIAPPFDSVGQLMHETLYERSPYNMVRLTLPKEEGYGNSRERLLEWLSEGVLRRDEEEAIYVEEQEFDYDGEKKRLVSFLALLRLDVGGENVFPHERIFDAPKRDRLELLRATRANLEPIHLLFRDPEGVVRAALEGRRPSRTFTTEDDWGCAHTVWAVTDPRTVARVAEHVSSSHLILADGHHRYAAALEFMQESPRDGQARYRMATFSPADDPNLLILPTHRLVSGADGLDVRALGEFDSESVEGLDDLRSRMRPGKDAVFGVLARDGGHILRLRDRSAVARLPVHPSVRRLDVTILHELVLSRACGPDGRIDYVPALESKMRRALDELNSSAASMLFILNPTLKEQVEEVALAGQRMPHKSTFFWPKVWSGLVLWKP